ncbi:MULTISPECIES: pilus assembly protein TadG-related protein [unclassified Streptomyces]|uniref:pilus assembly protein TadG-related protein n=1 Tax=unclassified Streptomyces TaxID=2593676 RepID=UPI0033D7A0C1
MIAKPRGDAGQAFPIYVVMVAGLLFLAFAFFSVGKATALRNGAQGAADSAALAAAQSSREQLYGPFIASLPGSMLDAFLQGHPVLGCPAAYAFAAKNEAKVNYCHPMPGGERDEIEVEVETLKPVGKSVIPSVENEVMVGKATAVIEWRCPTWRSVDFNDDGVQDMYFFSCRGGEMIQISPTSPPPWSQVSKTLFDVHLVDS